jgi:hypothetical protein
MTVIPFPETRPRRATDLSKPAVILVLPAIRIERYADGIEGLVGAVTAARVRSHVERLRDAVKGLPPALDERGEPV